MSIENEAIEFLLAYSAHAPIPSFRLDELRMELSSGTLQYFLDTGLLAKTGELSRYVIYEGGSYCVQSIGCGESRRHFILDEGEVIEIPVSSLELYTIDYGVMAGFILRDFKAKGTVETIMPGEFWKCGRYGRQQRELFLTRNAGRNANIAAALKEQPKRSIVLQVGDQAPEITHIFSETQVGALGDMLVWNEEGIAINMSIVEARITAFLDEREEPVHRTGKAFLDAKKKVESILREMYELCLSNARRAANDETIIQLPRKRIRRKKHLVEYQAFHDQATLAATAKITTTMMTQIKQEWEKFQMLDDSSTTYLRLLDFFIKQNFDSDTVFAFHDDNKAGLRAIGLYED